MSEDNVIHVQFDKRIEDKDLPPPGSMGWTKGVATNISKILTDAHGDLKASANVFVEHATYNELTKLYLLLVGDLLEMIVTPNEQYLVEIEKIWDDSEENVVLEQWINSLVYDLLKSLHRSDDCHLLLITKLNRKHIYAFFSAILKSFVKTLMEGPNEP